MKRSKEAVKIPSDKAEVETTPPQQNSVVIDFKFILAQSAQPAQLNDPKLVFKDLNPGAIPATSMKTPPEKTKSFFFANLLNVIISTLGMFSLGLLAMLITINNMREKNHNETAAYVLGILSFITAIVGKAAIVLYFNTPKLKKILSTIYEKGWIDFFKVRRQSKLSYIGWGINKLLGLNATLFWSGLVQISFHESAKLLTHSDHHFARTIGPYLGMFYVFIWFAACSFYANWLTWATVFDFAYLQKKSVFQWLVESPQYRNQKDDVFHKITQNSNKLLWELKYSLRKNEYETINKPYLNALESALGLPHKAGTFDNQLQAILDFLEQRNNAQTLRLALAKINQDPIVPISRLEWLSRHAIALMTCALAIIGFSNVIGLSDEVWAQWGMRFVSTYGARYLTFYGASEMILLTIYPMMYSLAGLPNHVRAPYVFSNLKLGSIVLLILFVGIFAGLSNGEQSELDQQSSINVVISIFASFLLDSFAIHSIGRSFYESFITDRKKTNPKIKRQRQFLNLQALIGGACDKDKISSSDWQDLIETQTPPGNNNIDRKLFRFWQNPFRKCFDIEDPAVPGLIVSY